METTKAVEEVFARERPRPAPVPLSSPVPERLDEEYPTLAAWYSGFSFCEHYRKVVQAQCTESIRAQMVGEKVTESRLEALARLHPAYLEYLRVLCWVGSSGNESSWRRVDSGDLRLSRV